MQINPITLLCRGAVSDTARKFKKKCAPQLVIDFEPFLLVTLKSLKHLYKNVFTSSSYYSCERIVMKIAGFN